jgi:glyoxylase-like metal-dependent hydrolase (beta-lactamase superfamily II)
MQATMPRITIGNVEVMPVQDCAILMDPKVFMPQHAEQWMAESGHEADERGLMPMSVTCFLVRSSGKTFLVDSGLGGRKRPGFPGGHLDTALKEAGVEPGEIDTVIHTHLHIDHVGWNTIETADGNAEVFFTNARHLVQQTEHDHWMRPEFMAAPEHAHLNQCVAPLIAQARVDLVRGETTIDQCLTFIPTPGHTPGHVAIGIASGGERAIIIGDASHHPIQLSHPDWSPAFDTDPVQSAQTRDRLFDQAAAEGRTWIAGHWKYPGLGRIVRLEGKRVFQAL